MDYPKIIIRNLVFAWMFNIGASLITIYLMTLPGFVELNPLGNFLLNINPFLILVYSFFTYMIMIDVMKRVIRWIENKDDEKIQKGFKILLIASTFILITSFADFGNDLFWLIYVGVFNF